MKKTLSLLLVLVMCLFLCACGGGNDTPEMAEIAEHPMLPYMYGRWVRKVEDGIKCSFNTIVINKDGTCVIDDSDARWEIDPNNTNYEHNILWVYFFDGSTKLGGVVIDEGWNNNIMFSTLEPEGWMSSATWEKQS